MREINLQEIEEVAGGFRVVTVLGGLAYFAWNNRADLKAILNQARRRNAERGLTGCLHHENGMFFQWLEGPRLTLSRLMERLRDDDRHVGVTVIDQGRLEERLFGNWQMRHSDPATASLLEWLTRGARGEADEIRAFLEAMG